MGRRFDSDRIGSVRPPGGAMDRRRFLRTGLAAGIAVSASCANPLGNEDRYSSRLQARVGSPQGSVSPGTHDLLAETGIEGMLFVPPSYDPATPAPLFVMLHGAGGDTALAQEMYPALRARGMLLLAPKSAGVTWDRIQGWFGNDVDRIDLLLEWIFGHCAVDPTAVVLAGFSDGATYALSLGPDNGDLFTHLIAYSPGFMAPLRPRGKPRIFVAHGTDDLVLPVNTTRRVIVPRLEDMGYDVTYREFEGIHALYYSIVTESLQWVSPATA